jgi:hypothetical protein
MFVKIPNVPCKQAICMTRHWKLYSGEIIEFQNFTIAPAKKPVNSSEERLVSESFSI